MSNYPKVTRGTKDVGFLVEYDNEVHSYVPDRYEATLRAVLNERYEEREAKRWVTREYFHLGWIVVRKGDEWNRRASYYNHNHHPNAKEAAELEAARLNKLEGL